MTGRGLPTASSRPVTTPRLSPWHGDSACHKSFGRTPTVDDGSLSARARTGHGHPLRDARTHHLQGDRGGLAPGQARLQRADAANRLVIDAHDDVPGTDTGPGRRRPQHDVEHLDASHPSGGFGGTRWQRSAGTLDAGIETTHAPVPRQRLDDALRGRVDRDRQPQALPDRGSDERSRDADHPRVGVHQGARGAGQRGSG